MKRAKFRAYGCKIQSELVHYCSKLPADYMPLRRRAPCLRSLGAAMLFARQKTVWSADVFEWVFRWFILRLYSCITDVWRHVRFSCLLSACSWRFDAYFSIHGVQMPYTHMQMSGGYHRSCAVRLYVHMTVYAVMIVTFIHYYTTWECHASLHCCYFA